jgi:hypothetical protein
LIFTRGQTLDAEELAIYWDEIRAIFLGHEVKVLAACGPHPKTWKAPDQRNRRPSKPSALFIRSAD